MPSCVGRVPHFELYMTWSPEGGEDENTMLKSSLFKTLNSEEEEEKKKQLMPKWSKDNRIKTYKKDKVKPEGSPTTGQQFFLFTFTIGQRHHHGENLRSEYFEARKQKIDLRQHFDIYKEIVTTSSWPARKETELWSIVTQGLPRTPDISCTFLSSVQRALIDTCDVFV